MIKRLFTLTMMICILLVSSTLSFASSHHYYTSQKFSNGKTAKYVLLNLNATDISPAMGLANNKILAADSLQNIVNTRSIEGKKAFAAVNGTYFSAYNGVPVPYGTIIDKGKLLHIGNYGDVLGITKDKKLVIDNLNIEIQNYKPTTLTNKTVNVDTSLKGNKDIASFAMAVMPDMQVVPDSNVSINIGTDGNANVTAMVKDGKDIVSRTESVPISSIPQRLLQNIDMNQRNSMYDADGGKMGYSWKSEILPTRKKVLEEYGDAISDPASEGIMSKEEILDSTEKVYGKKFVDEHRKVIEKEMERDITMQAKVVNGAYVMDISNGITTERRQLNTTNLGTQIDLITMQKDKMSSEFVIQNILKTLNKLK